jgi:hypothetical protein
MNENAIFHMPLHSACKNGALDVSTNAFQVVYRIAVTHTLNVLLDNRATI